MRDNPISNVPEMRKIKNLKLDEAFVTSSENSQQEDSDSEDWEQSAPTSELDISETSEEEVPLDDPLASALPQVARFTATGFWNIQILVHNRFEYNSNKNQKRLLFLWNKQAVFAQLDPGTHGSRDPGDGEIQRRSI